MGRKNRHTVKGRRISQRSKILRDLEGAAERVTFRTMNPRADERGAAQWTTLIVTSLVLGALAFTLLFAWFVPTADAKGARIQAPVANYPTQARNPVIYVERLDGPSRWFYVELADNSQWMMTRCRYDEVTGNPRQTCWWNARAMGDGEGRSFAVTRGVKHWYDVRMQP